MKKRLEWGRARKREEKRRGERRRAEERGQERKRVEERSREINRGKGMERKGEEEEGSQRKRDEVGGKRSIRWWNIFHQVFLCESIWYNNYTCFCANIFTVILIISDCFQTGHTSCFLITKTAYVNHCFHWEFLRFTPDFSDWNTVVKYELSGRWTQ